MIVKRFLCIALGFSMLLLCSTVVMAEDSEEIVVSEGLEIMYGEYTQEQLRTVYFEGLGLGMRDDPVGWEDPGEAFQKWLNENYGLGMRDDPV